ncbi:serine/threonine-protein kinase 19-like isoform X2 [Limulus polyphemus]|uniref:Serine/threonine-protein kinase 19-like isoform X2 n=1 Tax=Limulus polyphemus TaxID=6850 RepID=A0ABM1BMW3_LIMPO|nr:serine/threonine-protein kinase 19-like isoform X2 [Limulus polyphemus]
MMSRGAKRRLPDVYKKKKKVFCVSNGSVKDDNTFKEQVYSADIPNDTEASLFFLKSVFPVESFEGRLPPIILKHQIYTIVKNKTLVDKQVNELRAKNKIRLFKLGADETETAIVFFDDFKKHVLSHSDGSELIENFLSQIVASCPDISYNKNWLQEEMKFQEEDISKLMHLGLLNARDIGSWWLAIPRAGEFMKAFLRGRKAVLQALRRSKYKELFQAELESRNLPKEAKLGMKYHIFDIIGAEFVTCISTSSGKLLRLRD